LPTRFGLPTVPGVRWFGALLWLLGSLLLPSVALADPAATAPPLSALASGVPCGLLGDCARFDALGVHVGSTLGVAQSPSRSLLLAGRARVSVSMLDALEVSLSLGAQHDRAQQDASVSAQPLSLGVRLRLWPWFDRAGPDLALSLTQTVPSRWLGSGDAQPHTGVNLAGSKLWRWLALDGSVGVLWRDGVTKPLGLQLSASSFVRLYQTPDPTLPRDSYRAGLQASALFPLDAATIPSSLTALAVFEAATDRGLRFHLGIGAQRGASSAASRSRSSPIRGACAIATATDAPASAACPTGTSTTSWSIRSSKPTAASTPTRAASVAQDHLRRHARPLDASTIVHNDGRRFPVGLHVWIDKTDGTLMTEDRQILAKPDAKTAKLAIVVQQLAEW
jgi:hypothetical protein